MREIKSYCGTAGLNREWPRDLLICAYTTISHGISLHSSSSLCVDRNSHPFICHGVGLDVEVGRRGTEMASHTGTSWEVGREV